MQWAAKFHLGVRPETSRSLGKVLSTCSLFATNMQKFDLHYRYTQDTTPGERSARIQVETQSYLKIVGEDKYTAMVQKFFETFQSQLVLFLKELLAQNRARHDAHLFNLYSRLDYNNFYVPAAAGAQIA